MLYIGIDGGGTKTKMALFDEEGHKIDEILLPTVHVLTQPQKKAIQILKEGVDHLDPSQEAIIGAGFAGYGQQKEVRDKIEQTCQAAFGKRKFTLVSDVRIAIEGALDGQEGIVVIAGTGSIALSLKDNQLKRCGGWGYQLGDEGSAYWIVKEMLHTFCEEADGRLNKTMLYDLIMKECHLKHDYEIITFMKDMGNDRTKVASLAYINGLAAKANDPYALAIYKQAAKEINTLIEKLSQDFQSPFNVSYIGGVFEHASQYLLPELNKIKNSSCTIISPLHTPEYGAYMLAKKLR